MERAKQIRTVLDAAAAELVAGDAAAAERRAKAASALARAEHDVAALLALPETRLQETNEEALRAELRNRLARFTQADLADAPLEVLERIALGGLPQ